MLKHKLVDFIIQFMEEVDKEISEMKLFVSPSSWCFSFWLTSAAVERASTFRGRIFLDTRKLDALKQHELVLTTAQFD